MQISNKIFFPLYVLIFLFLSIPAFKLVGGIRVGQFFLLITFLLLLTDDIINHRLQLKPLLYFIIGAVVMSLISFNSMEMKFGEMKFVIKYFVIFPASFYVGLSVLKRIKPKIFITLLEFSMAFYALNAFLIAYAPIPKSLLDKVVSYREGWGGIQYLDFQGTFFEAGWLAMVLGSLFISALLLRYEYQLWSKRKVLFFSFYGFVTVTLLLSKNKTVWIAFIAIVLLLVLYKSMITLLYSNRFQPAHLMQENPVLKLLKDLDPVKVILGVLFFIILFFILNSNMSDPLISSAMLQEKLEKERGKVFVIVFEMLRDTHYFGGYGFGFVEAYFTLLPQDVIGLGEGSAMIFNSYMDIWLSASLFGLIFHLGLLYLSSSNRYYISLVLPLYYFIFANFNPATGDEYYYLFLGLSYGAVLTLNEQQAEKR